MKPEVCIIFATLSLSQFVPAQTKTNYPQPSDSDVIARRWAAKQELEAAQGLADAARSLEESRYRRAEEQRRQILWEREQAELRQQQSQEKSQNRQTAEPGVGLSAKTIAELRVLAEQGDADAQGRLGCCYGDGEGVPQDFVLAYMWLNLSAVKEPKAALFRREVEEMMTPEQIAEAQKLCREWKPKKIQEVSSSESRKESQGAGVKTRNPKIPTETLPLPSDPGAEFRRGFKDGYKKKDPYGSPPFPPLPEIGHSSYSDGFGCGYAQAIRDEAVRNRK